jgi:O-antigen/teichoic acid export membrane protein
VLYDPRYADAGWVVQVLALAAWFQILESTNGGALLSLGKPKWLAAGTGAKTLAIVALIPLGSMGWGFPGAVAALAAAELIKYVVSCWAVSRHDLATLAQDLPMTGLVLGSAAAAYWVSGLAELHALVQVIVITIIVTVIWLPLLVPMLRSLRLRSAVSL